eukprot:11190725-Lingulodinium_polyedra.AAC.1
MRAARALVPESGRGRAPGSIPPPLRQRFRAKWPLEPKWLRTDADADADADDDDDDASDGGGN